MKFIPLFFILIATSLAQAELLPKLDRYLSERQTEFDRIDAARRAELEPLAKALAERLREGRIRGSRLLGQHLRGRPL